MIPLKERLGREWLFCDGGSGTILQKKGLRPGELPESWNITHPEEVMDLYCGYLNAGSDIFNANTFGANRFHYPDNLEEVVTEGILLAKKAREKTGREDAYIALDIGPTGKLLEPMGDLSFEEAVNAFAEIVNIGVKAGADLVLIETMSDSYETKAAVLAAKENCDLPVLTTVTFDSKGKLLTGGNVESIVSMLEGLRVDALGINCSLGPREMLPIIQKFTEVSSLPVIVNPNAGLPKTRNGITYYDIDAEEFSSCMSNIADLGVQVIGGCCGTTPKHIQSTIEAVRNKTFIPARKKTKTFVSSYSQAVEINDVTKIIGERINPTGKKAFKQALRDMDIDYILKEGLKQEDAGAHILDVNVGLPEIDEPMMMEMVVKRLQAITSLPLQIDTSDPAALEKGMRYYNGKPMINSVNGKKESMDIIFPLVRKYGGVVVALCLDENGIPDNADGRIAIAQKILSVAGSYGIDKKDIVFDGLAMTISSDTKSAVVTLETIRRIHEELGCHTILGVSNISFGLPQRQMINSFFLAMAMENGLSCAIINPNNESMMSAYKTANALLNHDPQCMDYIASYANATVTTVTTQKQPVSETGKPVPVEGISLFTSIERGMVKEAEDATKKELSDQKDPLDIINDMLIPALDKVGQGFEKGTVYLPQLLMSADAAKAAFSVLKEAMKGEEKEVKGTIILATVKGDIHDIGKNIVKVMLENYGYEVIDLGKDVPPETIVATAIERNIKLVGLSALMTTTVPSMEETIKLLRKEKPDTKVVVGGAVLTQEYADMIGADAYGKDAMATVRYADSVFEKE